MATTSLLPPLALGLASLWASVRYFQKPPSTLRIEDVTLNSDIIYGYREKEITFLPANVTYVSAKHEGIHCLRAHEIRFSKNDTPHSPFDPPSTQPVHIGNLEVPLRVNLYEACKVCEVSSTIHYIDDNHIPQYKKYKWLNSL